MLSHLKKKKYKEKDIDLKDSKEKNQKIHPRKNRKKEALVTSNAVNLEKKKIQFRLENVNNKKNHLKIYSDGGCGEKKNYI
jgi:hypothetical protein